jgi:hypothetical protein
MDPDSDFYYINQGKNKGSSNSYIVKDEDSEVNQNHSNSLNSSSRYLINKDEDQIIRKQTSKLKISKVKEIESITEEDGVAYIM